MDIETVWYETVPFLYGIVGLVACFASGGSNLLKLSGVLLVIAALAVLRARHSYRRATFYEVPAGTELEAMAPTPES